MKSTLLADTLQILLPHLSPSLAAPEAIPPLQKTARLLAPIPRGGFECRLGADSQVDLQQCIVADNGEAAKLREHLARTRSNDFSRSSAWGRLYEFIRQWSDPSSDLHHELPEIWLEFDADFEPGAADNALPSLFLGLQQDLSAIPKKIAVTEMALDLLLGNSHWLAWQQNLRCCFEACPEGVFVSHIGVMLSRSVQALRVNVKRLQPDTLIPYLERVGWQGPTAELERLMAELYEQVDKITVCLDVGRQIYPKVGLECILLKQPPQEPRWNSFLAYLVERGWCTAEKQAALLKWPGQTNPTTTTEPWPSDLISASLVQPADYFTAFERRISHIKVVYQPQQRAIEAKGYLWFHHEWLQPKKNSTLKIKALPKEQWNPKQSSLPFLERVRAYHEATTELYVNHLGLTFQGSIFKASGDVTASNLHLARRAGIQSGLRILDAGCGVCGPAIDIAQAYPDVTIDGITISPSQVRIAKKLIGEAGLMNQVRVQLGDYHHLPWPANTFDVVIFFESSGHTETPHELFSGVYRVLRPGGCLYIKDAFHRPHKELSDAERRSLREFDDLFVYRTRTFEQTVMALSAVGFETIQTHDLTALVNGERWGQAIIEIKAGNVQLTPFGQAHQAPLEVSPAAFCGEVKARKPSMRRYLADGKTEQKQSGCV